MTRSLTDTPLFPLGTVLFPGGLLPLRIFEQRYLEMAKVCLREGTPFGVCLIREGSEVGAPATHEELGCLAQGHRWQSSRKRRVPPRGRRRAVEKVHR